jgi:DNA-binding transcriptional LysR family regulator
MLLRTQCNSLSDGGFMELRHLRYFQEVCRTRSFSRAAENLHIAQPPLSRQIQQLEQKLNATLFHRTRPLALTEAGHYLYQQLDSLFSQLDRIVSDTRRIAHHQPQRLNIGFAPSILYGQLPAIIRTLRDSQNIDVGIHEMATLAQIAALKRGSIDIGFGRIPIQDPDIVQSVLQEDPLLVALPQHHPLVAQRIDMASLSRQAMILYPASPSPSYADAILAQFRQRQLPVNISQRANDMQTAIGLVAAGLGIALVPDVARQIRRSGVVYRAIHDARLVSPIVVSHRKGDASPLLGQCRALFNFPDSPQEPTASGAGL